MIEARSRSSRLGGFNRIYMMGLEVTMIHPTSIYNPVEASAILLHYSSEVCLRTRHRTSVRVCSVGIAPNKSIPLMALIRDYYPSPRHSARNTRQFAAHSVMLWEARSRACRQLSLRMTSKTYHHASGLRANKSNITVDNNGQP
jgi:hypothetical protein